MRDNVSNGTQLQVYLLKKSVNKCIIDYITQPVA